MVVIDKISVFTEYALPEWLEEERLQYELVPCSCRSLNKRMRENT
jgi:hypothetical protein